MMEKIKSLAICLSSSVLIGSLIMFLSPKSSIRKSLRTVTVLFIIFSFILSLKNVGDIDIEESKFSFDDITSAISVDVNNEVINRVCHECRERIIDILDNKNIKFKDIQVITDIDENNSIVIKEIKLVLDKKYKNHQDEIKNEIYSIFSINGEFVWE